MTTPHSNEIITGRSAKLVTWPDGGNERGRCVKAEQVGRLVCEKIYHGEYDDFWIVEYDDAGKEAARHNMKFIESVLWL